MSVFTGSYASAAPVLTHLALTARALDAPSRLVLLDQLALGSPADIRALQATTGLAAPTLRQHLRLLLQARIVQRGGPPPGWESPGAGRPPASYQIDPEGASEAHANLVRFLSATCETLGLPLVGGSSPPPAASRVVPAGDAPTRPGSALTTAPALGVGHYVGAWTAEERETVERALVQRTPRPTGRWVCLRLARLPPWFVVFSRRCDAGVAGPSAWAVGEALRGGTGPAPDPGQARPLQRRGLTPARLRQAVASVWEGVGGSLPVEAIAERTGMSEAHFAREFKRALGVTVAAYVARVRLEEAARLLSTTWVPVGEVAARSGFGCHSSLSSRFRSWSGMTPSEYRVAHGDRPS